MEEGEFKKSMEVRRKIFQDIRHEWHKIANIIPKESRGYQGATEAQNKAYKLIVKGISERLGKMNPRLLRDVHNVVTIREYTVRLMRSLDYIISDRAAKANAECVELESSKLNSQGFWVAETGKKRGWRDLGKGKDWKSQIDLSKDK